MIPYKNGGVLLFAVLVLLYNDMVKIKKAV